MSKTKLEQLYIRYRNEMLGWAGAFFPEMADREDAVAEAFLRIMPHADKTGELDSPATRRFCYVVLKNVSLNILKRQKRETPWISGMNRRTL